MNKTTTQQQTAKDLENEWLALGCRPGVPFLPLTLVEEDKRIYRRMKCAMGY